jgi:hypothetical protein
VGVNARMPWSNAIVSSIMHASQPLVLVLRVRFRSGFCRLKSDISGACNVGGLRDTEMASLTTTEFMNMNEFVVIEVDNNRPPASNKLYFTFLKQKRTH